MSSSELFAKLVKKQPVEQKQKGEKKTTLQNKKQIVVKKEIQQQQTNEADGQLEKVFMKCLPCY